MPEIDGPTHTLARIYYIVWVTTIVMLVSSGVVHGLGLLAGASPEVKEFLPQLLVQFYLLLVPAAILVFSISMTARREWTLALLGYILTGVWAGAKLLG